MLPLSPTRPRGFSLVEVMIGFGLFTLLATGLSMTAIHSLRLAQVNVMKTTAHATAQGFLEQIKVLPADAIEESLGDPEWIPLPTRSISMEGNDAGTETQDPLYLSFGNSPRFRNHKRVVVDLREDNNGVHAVYLDMWIDLEVTHLMGGQGYLIELDFRYVIPAVGDREREASLRMVRTQRWGQSR